MSNGPPLFPNVPTDPISQSAAWWFNLIRTVGWPSVLLAVLAYEGTQFARWFEPRASRVIDTHVETVQGLQSAAKDQTRILGEMSESQKSQSEMIRDIHRAVVPGTQRATTQAQPQD